MRIKCVECGQIIEVPANATSYGCLHCGHFEYGETDTSPEPSSSDAAVFSTDGNVSAQPSQSLDRVDEAENYFLQATFILHSLQANVQVYGSNSAWSGANPADVDLALKYINRCLEIWPDNPKYLNLKALFLIEGKGDKQGGIALMERAAQLAPDDITIQDNLQKSKQDNCFIASAVFQSEVAAPVIRLRHWRDRRLTSSRIGRASIRLYYSVSPAIASLILLFPVLRVPLRPVLESLSRLADKQR